MWCLKLQSLISPLLQDECGGQRGQVRRGKPMMPMRGWMLSFLVALVLWPAVAYGQSPELKDAVALYKKLNAQGRYQEALPFAEITLRWSRREFGPDHPQVAMSLENYAALLRKSGRTTEADRLEARVKAIRAKHAEQNPAN